MNQGVRRWLALILLIAGCLGLPACGGGDTNGESEEVIGDSPEGVPVDELDDEIDVTGEAFPQGSAGVEEDEVGPEESLSDGQ